MSSGVVSPNSASWPPHRVEVLEWKPLGHYGDVTPGTPISIEASIPPMIGDLSYGGAGPAAQAYEDAVIAVVRLDAAFGQHPALLAEFLLHSESVGVSNGEAGWRAFGDALAGGQASADDRKQMAEVRALIALVETATTGRLTLAALLEAHRLLMAPYPNANHPGTLRTAQGWVGRSGSWPVAADHVAPPAELVSDLVDDLLVFANRSDLPILAQAAIAHAQFLSIHPFGDGNGRIGRALVNAILRRRGLTRRIAVPLSSATHTETDNYHAELNCYRRGDPDAIVGFFAQAVLHASEAAEQSAARLAALPQRWRDIARPPPYSADEALIDNLLKTPIFNAATAQQITGIGDAGTDRALTRLTEAGILDVLSTGAPNRFWGARDVLAELDGLPLVTRVARSPAVFPPQLESVMLLSSCRFRL